MFFWTRELLLLVLSLFHFKTGRRQTSHACIRDNIIHNRTVTDFNLSPNYLIIINF